MYMYLGFFFCSFQPIQTFLDIGSFFSNYMRVFPVGHVDFQCDPVTLGVQVIQQSLSGLADCFWPSNNLHIRV